MFVWPLGNYTRKIFKSICIILLIEMISWLTPNITSSVLRGMQLSTETYNAIYIPIASSAVSVGTSLFLPSLYWMRSLIFGHSSIALPNSNCIARGLKSVSKWFKWFLISKFRYNSIDCSIKAESNDLNYVCKLKKFLKFK